MVGTESGQSTYHVVRSIGVRGHESVTVEYAHKFGQTSNGAQNGEDSQQTIPHDQRLPQIELGPLPHRILEAEDDGNVGNTDVEAQVPVPIGQVLHLQANGNECILEPKGKLVLLQVPDGRLGQVDHVVVVETIVGKVDVDEWDAREWVVSDGRRHGRSIWRGLVNKHANYINMIDQMVDGYPNYI